MILFASSLRYCFLIILQCEVLAQMPHPGSFLVLSLEVCALPVWPDTLYYPITFMYSIVFLPKSLCLTFDCAVSDKALYIVFAPAALPIKRRCHTRY